MRVLLALALLAAGYWEDATPRAFLSLQPVVGAGYAQLTAQAGWGRPMWMWGGAEAFAFAAPTFACAYAGARVDLLAVGLRAGVRRTASFSRGPLSPGAAHSLDEFDSAAPHAAYTTLEAELSGGLPAPHGYAIWDFEAYRFADAPAGDLYEEWLKVAARPPWLAAARLGYLAALGRGGWIKLGALADLTATFGRGTLVRAGPLLVLNFTDHLDLVVLAAPALRSPDSLGLLGGMYGTARLRWTWATGEKDTLRL